MEIWTVLVWNMALGSRPRRDATKNWNNLWSLMAEHSIKVALLNEATTDLLKAYRDSALRSGTRDPVVYSEGGTLGRDKNENGEFKTRNWSTAVLSPHGPELITDARAVSAHPNPEFRRSPDIEFANSRPGSWTAARVPLGEELITFISLYGLLEELSDASMHRSLSKVSPIFSDPKYNELVLLGGDLNTSTATEAGHRERDRIVLDRIKAYGLIDCLAQERKKRNIPPLAGCRCGDDDCTHTLTRLIPNKKGKAIPWQKRVPYQMDYLFASSALAKRLDSCFALPPEEWEEYSDHSPIVARFRTSSPDVPSDRSLAPPGLDE